MLSTDAPNAKPRRLSRAARQEQLLNIADQLFTAQGYEYTSMEDICRAAGVSRPLVYSHYRSKEELYLACVRRTRVAYELDLLRAFEGTLEPQEQLRRAAEVYFGMIERSPNHWLLLYGGVGVPVTGELGQQLQGLRLQTHRFVTEQLRPHAPEQLPERLEAVAAALSGIFEQLGLWWLRRPEMSKAQVVALACELSWHGPVQSARPWSTGD